jgi:hypothetical protein
LLLPGFVHKPHVGELIDTLKAFTMGMSREIAQVAGAQFAVGADALFYVVPPLLRTTHGDSPKSLHLFLRVRPAASRMWNMVMTQPMRH